MTRTLIKKLSVSLIALGSLSAMTGSTSAAELDPAVLQTTVQNIGRINGQALACGYSDLVARAKTVVIARVPKTRTSGEAFESATSEAFIQQGSDKANCPPRTALAVELDNVVKPLAPPNAHQVVPTTEAPAVGINPRYLLQASNGRAIMDSDFPKHFQLITFGYTFCPDICPTTLLEMAEVMKQLGDQAAKVKPIFISVDPERDTLAQLRTFTAFFDPRILGVTGSPDLVKRAADNFKVRYEKVKEPGGNPAHYAVDHSAGMFLLAPGGQFLTKFGYGAPVAEIVSRLKSEIDLRAEAAPEGAKPAAPTPR